MLYQILQLPGNLETTRLFRPQRTRYFQATHYLMPAEVRLADTKNQLFLENTRKSITESEAKYD